MKNIFLSLLLLGVFYNKAYSAFCSSGTIEEVTNAITNGDFNDAGDGWVTGWKFTVGINDSTTFEAHGKYVFLWDNGTLSQTINIEKNTEYQIKFLGAYSVKKNGTSDKKDRTYKGQAVRFTYSNGNSIKQEVRHWIFESGSYKEALYPYTVDLGNSGNSTELTIKACAGGCTGASDSFIKIDYFRLYKCVPSSGGGDDDTPPPPPPPTSITKKVKLTIYNDDASFLAKEGNSHILHTKIVNKSFAFSIHSVDENKNDKVNTVAKNVKVRLIPATQSCSSSAGGFTPWISLALENKTAASALFNSSAVNKNLKVQIQWTDVRNNIKLECCSADNFAIRPDKFIIELAGKTLTNPLKAEEVVNMKVKAVDESNNIVTSYTNQIINETITDAKYSGDQKSHGLNVDGETVINGIVSKNTSYDEAGKLTITVEEKPPYFAEVDKNDGSAYKITKATYQVRVVPDHFGISYTMQDQNPSNNITFIANNLTNMRSTLSYTVKAEGKYGKTLTRYTKDKYADDVDITVNHSTTTEGSRNVTLNYKNSKTNSSKTFNTSAGTNLTLNFLQSDFTNGILIDNLYENFSRDPKVAQNPIILSTNTISAKEKNGVGSYKATGSQTSSQQANFYYGRVHAPSPQTSDQPSMLAKVYYEIYYNGSASNKSLYPKSQGQASIDSVYWYILPPSVVSGFSSGICDYNSVSVASSGATAFRHGIYDINVTAANLPHANKIYYIPNVPYLMYDKIGNLLPKHYFDVKFTTSNTTWAGEGKTGHTVDTNISTIDNRSLDW